MSADLFTVLSNQSNRESAERRLLNGVRRNPGNGCWEWQRAKNPAGYGKLAVGHGIVRDTHRVSYALFCGDPAEAGFVCHRCDNPACVNPAHLFPGTAKDNAQDMMRKGRNRQPRGSASWKAKITESDVVRIREQYARGRSRAEIAAEYGLDDTTITSIARGRIWKHVPGSVPPRGKGRKPKPTPESRPC